MEWVPIGPFYSELVLQLQTRTRECNEIGLDCGRLGDMVRSCGPIKELQSLTISDNFSIPFPISKQPHVRVVYLHIGGVLYAWMCYMTWIVCVYVARYYLSRPDTHLHVITLLISPAPHGEHAAAQPSYISLPFTVGPHTTAVGRGIVPLYSFCKHWAPAFPENLPDKLRKTHPSPSRNSNPGPPAPEADVLPLWRRESYWNIKLT